MNIRNNRYSNRLKYHMSSGPQNQNNQGNPSNPVLTWYNEWSERTPFVTRSTVIVLIISYITSFFYDASDFFANIPEYTYLRFEIYRLLLNPFVGNSILMLIMILIMFVVMSGKFESSQGSLRFLFLMGTMCLLTNLLFSVVCFFCLIWFDDALSWVCQGFWNVTFSLITIDCMLVSH